MKRLAVLLIFLLTSASHAIELSLPAKVTGDVGAFVRVASKTDGTMVQWYSIDPGLNLFPVELLKDTKTAVVSAGKAGNYRLLAYTSDKDGPSAPALCTVVIGDPGPGPGPDPNPQPPSDPFYPTLETAFQAEAPATRLDLTKKLAALYRQAGTTTVNDPTLKTAGDLLTTLQTAAASMIGKDTLPTMRKAIATELNGTLPLSPTAALDTAARNLCAAQFSRMAKLLEVLK